MEHRPGYELRFADGGVLALGHVTRVMGVLNVTPDSFSDGGRFDDPQAAADAARRMIDDGADLIDVGGESTRPGADAVDADEETRRVVPLIERLKRRGDTRISVDTMKAEVARRALDAGADMINDVSALGDPRMLPLLCERRVPVVLMHMRGSPRTMQRETRYDDLIGEVASFLEERARSAVAAGVSDGKIVLDPGIGFGKSVAGNLTILRQLTALHRIGRPILIGASRKSFIGEMLDLPVDERLEGSLAAAAIAAAHGAHVVRVHDVRATARVVRMVDAIRSA